MTRLSVNINKFATLRNARGGNNPDLIKAAIDAELFGAQGITIHPRPDQRHIRTSDVFELAQVVKTELNIEGNPTKDFIDLVCQIKPAQVTLVPDAVHALTSDAGWDTVKHKNMLSEIVQTFQAHKIRVSIFINPLTAYVDAAAATNAECVELYTGPYAEQFHKDKFAAITPYIGAAKAAHQNGLLLNAGHDLDAQNLAFFKRMVEPLHEVSIGHALICDAIYWGLEKTIKTYLLQLT